MSWGVESAVRLTLTNGRSQDDQGVVLFTIVGCSSPDPNPLIRLHIQPIPRYNSEGLVPSVDIAHGVASIFARRMCISGNLPAQCVLTLDLPPSPGERKKKALLTA